MKKKLIQTTTDHFLSHFQKAPEAIFLSPGRINLIGEHVDYNDGFVMPAAINKYICFAISKTNDAAITLVALDLNETYQFKLTDELKPVNTLWVNYILGVFHQLKNHGLSQGCQLVFSSTIPMGAGLSSSAALECGVAYAMNKMFDLHLSKQEIALIGQKSEHTFVGVNCGIMDQFASVFGKKNSVIKLDCNTLDYEHYRADFKKYALLLLDSNVKHTHLTSGYNDRRREVEEGLAIIKQRFPELKTFRDCTEKMVIELHDQMGETRFKRCHFVVNEIQRVGDAAVALKNSDFKKLGELMTQTHHGLSTLYEVSCPELDFLVEAVHKEESVLGARMMGGGFGGCTINLVEKGAEIELIEKITTAYFNAFGIELKAYTVNISKGTSQYHL
jgi:galactokinase